MGQGWLSYDPIAATYERLAVPHLFAPIAQDHLVALLQLPPGAITLDDQRGHYLL